MHYFIEKYGWTATDVLPQDGSARSYIRIEKDGCKALFMDCGPLTGISYITKLSDFIAIGDWLRSIDVRTPEIYEADEDANLAIIEDFGSTSMKQAMADGHSPDDLYAKANEICEKMKAAHCPLPLPKYQDSFMRQARMRLVDWYIPAIRQETNSDDLRESYDSAWDQIENSLDPYEDVFMHVDFHAENLMVLDNGSLGVIDFQEGMLGPAAYDLVNLLEDMRMDVPLNIQVDLLQGRDANFMNWYRVLGTQFHGRLLGQCVRWAVDEDKPQYLEYLPRLWNYWRLALEHPVLEPIKRWSNDQGLHFIDPSQIDIDALRAYIAKDVI